MQVELLEQMRCPYCGAGFRITRSVVSGEDRLTYGLVECRCFVFPVVDGILLLSLAKGYGGAEEALQPYVPLQVAAIRHLETGDVQALRSWIRRHAPLAADLIEGTDESYLGFAARRGRELNTAVHDYLADQGVYGVLGHGRPGTLRRAKDMVSARRGGQRRSELPTPDDYYETRFFSPRVNALALQLAALPPAPRLLSLCCGHGVFENLLRVRGARDGSVVSVDGQFLNLLITRRYADHGGSYICHDLQFPLPFADGAFDGVFSSTCLPEIPTQRTFAAEAIRVTAEAGWTDFDSIWNTELGAARVDPLRHYRFCQNFFADLTDYVAMFEACAGSRAVGVDVPDTPAAYLAAPGWAFGADVQAALANRADHEISVLVTGSDFPGFVAPDHRLPAADLAVSYAFDVDTRGDRIELRRRHEFETLHPVFASKQFEGYPPAATIDLGRVDDDSYRTELFVAALVGLVPPAFTDDPNRRLKGAGTTDSSAGPDEHGSFD